MSSVACAALQFFPNCLINSIFGGKKVVERKMCVFIFSAAHV